MLRQGSFRLPHGAGDRRGQGQQHKVFDPTKTKKGSTAQGQTIGSLAESKAQPRSGPVGEGIDSMDSGLDDIGVAVKDNDDTESSTADTASVISRKKGKGRSMPKRAGQPRQVYCHLCGQPTDIKTFRSSHLKVCRRIWREDENSTVKALIDKGLLPHGAKGRPFPPEPMLPLADGDELVAPDETIDDEGLFYINELARHIWKTHAQYQCPYCQRGFNHGSYLHHAMGCHPVQSTVHFGRKDHTFHSVEAAVTKSYKQPHAFHDAPVSRPDGPHAAQLGPDGLPLYLNRENVEAWRGVPSVASLRQQERLRQQTPSARNSTENGLSSSRIDGTGSANDNNTSLRAMLIAAQNGYKSRKRSSSSGPGSSRGSLLGEAFAVGNADNESSSHRSSGINLGKGRSKSAGRADSGEGQRSSGVSALAAQVKGNVGGSGVLRSFDKTVSFRPLPGGASFDWEEDWSFAKASNGRASASGAVGSSHSMNVAAGVGDPQDSSSDTSDESPPYASTQQHSTSTETERTAAAEAATMARLSSSLKPWQPVGKAKPVLTRPGSANTAKWAAAPRLRHRQSGSTSGSSTSSSSRKQTTAGGASEEVPEDAHRTSRSARERDAPFAQFDGEVRRRNGHSNAAASNRAAATPASSYHGSGGRGGSDSGNSNGSGNGAYSPPPLLASDDPAFTVEAARAQARAKNRGPNRQRPWAADIPTSSHAPSQGHAVTARSGTTSSTAPPATKPFLRRSSCSGPLGMSRQTSNYSSSSSSSSSFRRFNSSSSGSGVDSAAALRQSLADGSLGVQAALEALADAVARLEAPRRPPTTRSGAAAKHTETSLAAQGFEERYTRAPEALLRDDIRVNVPSSSSARGAEVPNCSHAPTALQPHNDNLRTSARDELPVKQHASNWSLSSHQLPGPPQRAWSEFEVPEAALESDYRPPSRLHRKEHRKAFASSLHASMRPALLHEPIAVENE